MNRTVAVKTERVQQVPVARLRSNCWGRSVNPPISARDYDALRRSIEADGIQVPLIAWESGHKHLTVVAGTNRLKIARELGEESVPVIVRKFGDIRDAKRFARVDNLARRHMGTAERAELALALQEDLSVGRGRRSDLRTGNTKVDARAEAARQSGVSPVSMSHMRRLLDHGDRALLDAVREGRMRLSAAVRAVSDAKPYKGCNRRLVVTGDPVLSAYCARSADVVAHIARLYLRPGQTVCDITYGRGHFWQRIDRAQYDFHGSDIAPQMKGVVKMVFRRLRYPDGYADAVFFDPPFLSSQGDKSIHRLRYRSPRAKGIGAVLDDYRHGMAEARRILKPDGILVVKCVDEIIHGRFCPVHIRVYGIAVDDLGFKSQDLFIQMRSGVGLHRNPVQRHSRRNYSYFWVFQR